MVDKILTAAGLTYRRGRYIGKADAYAVYMDDLTTMGPDGRPLGLVRHDATVELYVTSSDGVLEAALEEAIAAEGLQFEKQDRYWLQAEQCYQVVYDFTFFEKRRA